METANLFNILDRVDSTNNYAMQSVHAGMAKNGQAWFTYDQFAGKGQRGKSWESTVGQNIAMSIALKPRQGFLPFPFVFNAIIANSCRSYFSALLGEDFCIKWPNDIYYGDRKAGGILIENIFQGKEWKWSVVGIGINVNQHEFPPELINPVSLQQICSKNFDVVVLAKGLHQNIVETIITNQDVSAVEILDEYNHHLYGKNQTVRLRRQNMVFETTIIGVDLSGYLLTEDAMPRQFGFGEVEWIL